MRKTNSPPRRRASSQQYSAVRAPPICRKPVGLGAKRVRTVIGGVGGMGMKPPILADPPPITDAMAYFTWMVIFFDTSAGSNGTWF
jgi:hypothetical protein